MVGHGRDVPAVRSGGAVTFSLFWYLLYVGACFGVGFLFGYLFERRRVRMRAVFWWLVLTAVVGVVALSVMSQIFAGVAR